MKRTKILWISVTILFLAASLLAEHSIGPAPMNLYRGTSYHKSTDKEDNLTFYRGEITYGIESSNGFFGSFDTDTPETLVNIAPEATAGFSNAGDFDIVDQSMVYELDNEGNFGTYDIVTGAWTSLGTITLDAGYSTTGMAVDPTTGTFYVVATDATLTSSNLYEIDEVGLNSTLIGPTGCAGLIALAIDGNGDAWTYCLVADEFYSIDLATGATTLVGPLGFDANYGQGMTWDPITGEVLMSAFNNTTFQPELRLVDLTTGSSTLMGVLGATDPGGLCQFGWIAIPGDYEPPVYCESTWNNDTDDWITNVTFNTINNDTGQEGGPESYGDYTDISTTVIQGDTYNFSMTWLSDPYTECGAVWFDWNRDYDFFDDGEYYELECGVDLTTSMDIMIPEDAHLGNTRMRVSERYFNYPEPCNESNSSFGETEDYTVNIIPPPSYCTASGGNDEYIDGVIFNTINNMGTGYTTGYEDFTALSTDIVIGLTYDLYFYTGNMWSSDDYGVWIDWNQDMDFYDAGENVVCLANAGADEHIFPIEVPADAMDGATRMRLRLKYSGDDCGDPCGDTTFGEVEDYTVVISGTPPDFGYIEGIVTLDGGEGDVEDVMITAGGETVYPDNTGFYSIELYPGTYDLDAALEGYFSYSYDDIVVTEGNVTTHDFTMEYIVPGELPIMETFDEGIPIPPWEIDDGFEDGVTWYGATDHNGQTLDGTPFAFVNSDGNMGVHLMEGLITPYADASEVGALLLEFDQFYNYIASPEYAAVDVWDGTGWQNVALYMEDHGAFGAPEHVVIDITEHANANLQVRFFYDDGDNWAWYWAVDNVHVYEPLFGTVSGNVTEFGTGVPIEDAHVYFDGYEDYTDASGYYEITPVLTGTYTVMVESDYYIGDEEPGVVVTDGGNTVVDFELYWSEIDVDPTSFNVNVAEGNTLAQTMIITNDGNGILEYGISVMEDDLNNRLYLPPFKDEIKRSPYKTSIGPAPMDGIPYIPSDTPVVRFEREDMAYGMECSNGFLCSFDLAIPEVLNNIGPEATVGFSNAGVFGLGDQSFVYELDNEGNFGTYDIETGAWTGLGTITLDAGYSATGMTVDPTTGTFYVVAPDAVLTASNLYEIDVDNLTATLIGATGQPGLIDLCVDGNGDMWSYDLVTDEFVQLDKATGAATVIGALGYDANYGQGMAWDAANDIVYLSAFNNGTFQPELRIADRTTGNTTMVGVLGATDPGGLCQLGWMAIPGAGVAWLSFEPNSGTVDPDGGQEFVTATFDATDLVVGDIKLGTIHISNNANYMRGDDYLVPVTMIVVPDAYGENDLPLATKLNGNYPNPFNPITTIAYQIKEDSNVDLSVYNIRGEKVTTLVNDQQAAGNYEVIWNGTDTNGKEVSSGIYFYKMKTGRYTSTKKMILMK